MGRAKAMRLLRALIDADAIDHAYLARLEKRIPEVLEKHPKESTDVGVELLFHRNVTSEESPATRISKLHAVLGKAGIKARSTGSTPLSPARLGTVRMFRAETDRLGRNGHFEGWQRETRARGRYFTTSPIVAAHYGEPKISPRGAPLRYVDVPRAVADSCRIDRPDILASLKANSQRLPQMHAADELEDTEYYLDPEWAGRAVPVPAVVEAGNAVSSSNVFDTEEWWFGREELLTAKSSPVPAQITVQYIAGPAVDHDGENIPREWRGSTRSAHRHYANADVIIPVDRDSVMFIRSGVEAHSVELLLTILTGTDAARSRRVDFAAVEAAFGDVEHLITGDAAAVLQGTIGRARRLDAVEVTVPRSAIAHLAHVVARSDAAPSNASSIGWSDEASVMRKFLSAKDPVPLRSMQWGCVNVKVIDDETFALMNHDIVSATLSTPGRDGAPERVALQMARTPGGGRKTGARRTRGQGLGHETA